MPDRATIIAKTKIKLEEEVDQKTCAFVGPGAERRFGINRVRFNSVVTLLREEGYVAHYLELEDPSSDSEDSNLIIVKVLAGQETSSQTVWNNRGKILKMWQDAQVPA